MLQKEECVKKRERKKIAYRVVMQTRNRLDGRIVNQCFKLIHLELSDHLKSYLFLRSCFNNFITVLIIFFLYKFVNVYFYVFIMYSLYYLCIIIIEIV